MSKSTESSQDCSLPSSDIDSITPSFPQLSGHNANLESGSEIEYTYHRHSAPKNVIYYRCSDKRCPAKLRYNPSTKSFSMKNQHLNPGIHKKANYEKVITSDELINFPDYMMRGPLLLSKAHAPKELDCDKDFSEIRQKRPHANALLNSIQDKPLMLSFKVIHNQDFESFSKKLLDKCLASKVFCYAQRKLFTYQKCENSSEMIIEVYTSSHFMGKVLLHIYDYFGRGAEVLFFQID